MSSQDEREDDVPIGGFDGATAIVTGAASGIGAATARALHDAGARVVVADVDGQRAREYATQLGNAALGVEVDVSEEPAVEALFAATIERFGTVDVLINNAAYRAKADFMTMPVEEWDRMLAVCTRGTFLCMRAAIRLMRADQHGGAIVNVSSVSATHPTIFANGHYDAAKAGVDALTRYAAVEFGPEGIRVNSVQPGGTATEGSRRISGSFTAAGPMAMPNRIPLGGRNRPEDVAQAILFLAGSAASRITGQLLAVDGGYLVA